MTQRNNKSSLAAILVVSTFLGALGQLLFKLGVSSSNLTLLILYLGVGVFSYVISSIVYFYALSRMHLSWVYSFGGLSYIFTSILALLVLNESIPFLRWTGIFVIAIGVALIGLS